MKTFYRGFKRGMHEFGQTLATLVNTILLFIVYIIGVGITALWAKITKKKFLTLKPQKEKQSYWGDLNIKTRSKERHYRQF